MEHLVVVLPGIGGSVLEDECGPVWDAGIGDIAGLVVDPQRLDLGSLPSLTATGLISSTKLLPGWTVVCGYEMLMASLGGLAGARVDLGNPVCRDLSATVVAVPYDFRRSVVAAAEDLASNVKARLSALGAGRDERRVIVVAHSMGGLVARYWLGPLGGWKCCRALITLGTPHRGAPKALAWLVNGAHIGVLKLGGVSELVRGWPSVFELLPRYQAVWNEKAGAACYPHDLPIDWFAPDAKRAFEMHGDIESAWDDMPRTGPETVAMVGWSHTTLLSATWDGRLRVGKVTPGWLEAPGWEADLGDGTVPTVSAVPLEMAGAQRALMRVQERHGPLSKSKAIAALVAAFEGRGSLASVRGDEARAALGLDLEDSYLVGEPLGLSVSLHQCEATDDTEVWATVRDPGAVGRRPVRLERGGDGAYSATDLVVASPGAHDLEVVATGLEGAGDLVVSDSFVAVDPA